MSGGAKLSTSTEGMMLARACQDYGLLIGDRAGTPSIYVEHGFAGTPQATFSQRLIDNYQLRPLMAVINNLRRIQNHTESTPFGAARTVERRGIRYGTFA